MTITCQKTKGQQARASASDIIQASGARQAGGHGWLLPNDARPCGVCLRLPRANQRLAGHGVPSGFVRWFCCNRSRMTSWVGEEGFDCLSLSWSPRTHGASAREDAMLSSTLPYVLWLGTLSGSGAWDVFHGKDAPIALTLQRSTLLPQQPALRHRSDNAIQGVNDPKALRYLAVPSYLPLATHLSEVRGPWKKHVTAPRWLSGLHRRSGPHLALLSCDCQPHPNPLELLSHAEAFRVIVPLFNVSSPGREARFVLRVSLQCSTKSVTFNLEQGVTPL